MLRLSARVLCCCVCAAGAWSQEDTAGPAAFWQREIALHPGDLPEAPDALFESAAPLKFLRFRPPRREPPGLPHIRLDRAMEFLIGDRMR